jgi:hypothetical protein
MIIAWDEPKRLANLAKHGRDFVDLTLELFETSFVLAARSPRFKAIGMLGDEAAVVVILAPLGSEGISIISMRAASEKERKLLHGAQTRP